MGSVLMGIVVVVITGIVLVTCIASGANPFIGLGVSIMLSLLIVGALVDWFGQSVATIIAGVLLGLLAVALIVFAVVESSFRDGPVPSRKTHRKIGQTRPDVVIRETSDPDDDPYDRSQLTSQYDSYH